MTFKHLVFLIALLTLSQRNLSGAVQKVEFGAYRNYNILLITIDTLRADHLPMYGYKGVTTPHLDELSDHSFVFEDAISHAPLTLPSHTSILTGLLPPLHGVRDNSGFFLDPKHVTLAEILKTHGYTTSAFVSSFILDSRWQLNQGFDFYYDYFNLAESQDINPRDVQRRGEETEIEAVHWLEANKDRHWFSWIHFYDPHDPYDPPEPFKTEYASHPYDGEIAYTDQTVGKLLQKLAELRLRDRTLIIVTGDHGENLGEHNEKTHAMFIYDATQHIPLMIHLPGMTANRIPGIVTHIDLAPTILELIGIHALEQMQGMSLIPSMNGREKANRTAYSESIYCQLHYGWSPLKSLRTPKYLYIDAPKPELYDRIQDPHESRNLIDKKAVVASQLRKRLEAIVLPYSHKRTEPQKMDAEMEEKLRSLGYVGSTVQSTEESRKSDPKDKVHLARAISESFGAIKERDYPRAIEVIKPVLSEDPNMVDAHMMAGIAYLGLEDYQRAIDELLKTIALRPEYTMPLYYLGYAYQLSGNLPEAERWYQKVLKYEKNHNLATLRLAHVYRLLNQPEKAKKYFLATVKRYQDSLEKTKSEEGRSGLYSTLGEIYFAADDMNHAETNLKAAVSLTPDRPTLHYNLAQVYEARHEFLAAVDEYRKETEVDPSGFKAFNNLGILYRQLNRLEDAIPCFQKMIDLNPKDWRGYLLLVSTYKRLGKDEEAQKIINLAQKRGVEMKRLQ